MGPGAVFIKEWGRGGRGDVRGGRGRGRGGVGGTCQVNAAWVRVCQGECAGVNNYDNGGGNPLVWDDTTPYIMGDDCSIHIYTLSPRAAILSADNDPRPTILDKMHVIGGGAAPPPSPVHDPVPQWDDAFCRKHTKGVHLLHIGGFPAIVPRGRWCFHSQRIGCLALSPDGTVLASSKEDYSISSGAQM